MRALITVMIGLALLPIATTGHAEQQTVDTAPIEAISERGYHYHLEVAAEKIEVMKPLPVTLTIIDPFGEPVSDAVVTCSLTMPAMAMPLNTPTLKKASGQPGFHGIFLLTMGGLWQMETTAIYPNALRDTAVLPFRALAPDSDDPNVNQKLENLFHEQKGAKQP